MRECEGVSMCESVKVCVKVWESVIVRVCVRERVRVCARVRERALSNLGSPRNTCIKFRLYKKLLGARCMARSYERRVGCCKKWAGATLQRFDWHRRNAVTVRLAHK